MKIMIACDSFKGGLSSEDAARCIMTGVRRIFPTAQLIWLPAADGGEGTAAALTAALKGRLVEKVVAGPLGAPVTAAFGLLPGGEAVLDMASASGLTLVPRDQLNVMATTTYGTGQLLQAALDQGCRRIYLGIGGSATNDGGLGLAQAIGVRFLDKQGRDLSCPDTLPLATPSTSAGLPPAPPLPATLLAGRHLEQVAAIDDCGLDPRIHDAEIYVLCDVANPLCGPQGAAYVYGPQKGAGPAEVTRLDNGLARFAAIFRQHNGSGQDLAEVPGAGAAGGLGFGLLAFTNAKLCPGIDFLLETTGFARQLQDVDLVITGEGCLDSQSAYGKTPAGIARKARGLGIPVVAVAGALAEDLSQVYAAGISACAAGVCAPMSLSEALANAQTQTENAAERLMRAIAVGMALGDSSGKER